MIAIEAPIAETRRITWDEALFQLELCVARRADELMRGQASDPDRDRLIWFEAERIVLGEVPAMIGEGAVVAA